MNVCFLAAITLLSVCALSNARVQITRLSKYHQSHAIVLPICSSVPIELNCVCNNADFFRLICLCTVSLERFD